MPLNEYTRVRNLKAHGKNLQTHVIAAHLHLVHDLIGPQNGVVLIWILSHVLLRPRGLATRGQANHHYHLEGGKERGRVRSMTGISDHTTVRQKFSLTSTVHGMDL